MTKYAEMAAQTGKMLKSDGSITNIADGISAMSPPTALYAFAGTTAAGPTAYTTITPGHTTKTVGIANTDPATICYASFDAGTTYFPIAVGQSLSVAVAVTTFRIRGGSSATATYVGFAGY
jgi:hypothetical protein